MLKANMEIGWIKMEAHGETPSEVFLAIQSEQDLMCLVRQAEMFGEADKGQKLLNDYIRPAFDGELTLGALKALNIEFEPGTLRCVDVVEE